MKRFINYTLLLLVIAVGFTACSGSKNLSSSNTTDNVSRGKFTGTWVLNTVDYDKLLPSAVSNVFDQAKPADFIGSTWKLTNSGNGIYQLNNGTSQTIYWSVNNSNPAGQMFQFKKIYQGDKAKNVDAGYQLMVDRNDGRNMVLRSPVDIGGGSTGYIVYTFSKQ